MTHCVSIYLTQGTSRYILGLLGLKEGLILIDKDEYDRDAWGDLLEVKNPWQRRWFTDEEAAEASGLTPRGLRTLQALNFTRAQLASRRRGARVRMWCTEDVLRACLVHEFSRYAGLAAPTAVRLLQLVPDWIMDELTGQTAGLIEGCAETPRDLIEEFQWLVGDSRAVRRETGDISLAIIDGEHVFISGRYPELREDSKPAVETDPIGSGRDVNGRNPEMGRLTDQGAKAQHDKLLEAFDHPIASSSFNLELALRWRVSFALGLDPSR